MAIRGLNPIQAWPVWLSQLIFAPGQLRFISGIAHCLTCPLGIICSQPLIQLTGNMVQLSLCIWQITRITTSKHNLHLKSVHKICSFFLNSNQHSFLIAISLQFLNVLRQQRNFWSLLNGRTKGQRDRRTDRKEGQKEWGKNRKIEEQKEGRMDGKETTEERREVARVMDSHSAKEEKQKERLQKKKRK